MGRIQLSHKLTWAVAALLTLAILAVGYLQGRWAWEGTGFSGASLWDWLDLLIVPLILGIGGFWLQRSQRQRELEDQQSQTQREREADRRSRRREVQMEELRRRRELETEEQRAQTVALQAYLEQMARLLLEEGLHMTNVASIDDIIHPMAGARVSVARAYTLTTLERMDSIRKRSIVRFLFEAKLCTRTEGSVVSLKEADLTRADLRGMNLPGIDLTSADLRKADLSDTQLVSLEPVRPPGVSPGIIRTPRPGEDYFPYLEPREYSILDETDLRGADLRNAKLQYCSFDKTQLKHADLRGADLRKAKYLRQEQLEEAMGDQGTLLPEICHPPEDWRLSFEEQLRRLNETKR